MMQEEKKFLLFTVNPVRGLRNSLEFETTLLPWCNFYSRAKIFGCK